MDSWICDTTYRTSTSSLLFLGATYMYHLLIRTPNGWESLGLQNDIRVYNDHVMYFGERHVLRIERSDRSMPGTYRNVGLAMDADLEVIHWAQNALDSQDPITKDGHGKRRSIEDLIQNASSLRNEFSLA